MLAPESVPEEDVGKLKTVNFTSTPLGAGWVSVSVPVPGPQMMIKKTMVEKNNGREKQ